MNYVPTFFKSNVPEDDFLIDLPMYWVENDPPLPKKYYKIYNDGSHYVATLCTRSGACPSNEKKERSEMDIYFDNLYFSALQKGLRGAEITEFIKSGLLKLFSNVSDSYIEKRLERVISNLYKRKKRFRRKANLNNWNYFVTLTYNDIIHTEETFYYKLRKCLSNLHTRRNWRYMGVFERAPDTNRLHFHGLFYIPDGEMIGSLTESKDYDTRHGKMQVTVHNSFFMENYGRNDFKELDGIELKQGKTIDYLLKYIGKTNERIVYSRGIPTVILKELQDEDLAAEMLDFVTKYVLFDDVIDWETDIFKAKGRKQATLWDLFCNPLH